MGQATETAITKTRLDSIITGTVFRLFGATHYFMKIDEPTEGNTIRAVCLNTLDRSGVVETFEGDTEAVVGPTGLPTDCLLPLGF